MLRRLLAPTWPPIAGLTVALVVLVAVLVITPPGLASLPEIVLGPARSGTGAAAAYAAGAATCLALVALLIVAPALALTDLLARCLKARIAGRRTGKPVQ